jgi:hypothetical protein
MTDKQPMQANGGRKPVAGDGVSDVGKKGDGESSGAAYPNPHTGEEKGGFDGGQSDKSYSGPDNPNATAE